MLSSLEEKFLSSTSDPDSSIADSCCTHIFIYKNLNYQPKVSWSTVFGVCIVPFPLLLHQLSSLLTQSLLPIVFSEPQCQFCSRLQYSGALFHYYCYTTILLIKPFHLLLSFVNCTYQKEERRLIQKRCYYTLLITKEGPRGCPSYLTRVSIATDHFTDPLTYSYQLETVVPRNVFAVGGQTFLV